MQEAALGFVCCAVANVNEIDRFNWRARRGRPVTLLFQPSSGLGGGIERYLEWLRDALAADGEPLATIAFLTPGIRASLRTKLRFVWLARREIRASRQSAGPIIIGHLDLAPGITAAAVLAGAPNRTRYLICHGQEVWGMRSGQRALLKRLGVRLVTVSSFSAGALTPLGTAAIVSPGLSATWREKLISLPIDRQSGDSFRVISVFRLSAAQDKGLPTLLAALDHLRQTHVSLRLTIAGSGQLPPNLDQEVRRRAWVDVISNPNDDELVELYGASDLCVLATRFRRGRRACGEGFGLTLLEAQLAGLPVVVPVVGGSDDAFVPGVTGLKPLDEGSAALADSIQRVMTESDLRSRLAANARLWASSRSDELGAGSRARSVFTISMPR